MKKVHTRYGSIAMISLFVVAAGCSKKGEPADESKKTVLDYQQEMRTFIKDISAFANT